MEILYQSRFLQATETVHPTLQRRRFSTTRFSFIRASGIFQQGGEKLRLRCQR